MTKSHVTPLSTLGDRAIEPATNTQPASASPVSGPVLELQDVFKIYREQEIESVALRGASLKVEVGEFVAIVGRSGSGKSTLLGIAAGLISPSAGKVLIAGQDIAHLNEEARANLRQHYLGIVFQNNNLIPFLSARENVELAITRAKHGKSNRRARAVALLGRVGLAERLDHRPARLSGGEQQRVAIAVALANDPALLVADELTGELDSTTAATIMQLLGDLNRERGMAIVLVTHNLQLAARAGRSLKMTDGLLEGFDPVAEQAEVDLVPQPRPAGVELNGAGGPLILEGRELVKTFKGRTGVQALSGISLAVQAGESLAIMGPSGSGKSTLLNLLGGLDRPTQGEVTLSGRSLSGLDNNSLALVRRREIGFIFQSHNLLATLTATENVALPLLLDGVATEEREVRAVKLLAHLGLADLADKLPDQLSGGQRQRVAIARALAHQPKLVLADEPTGSLDSDTAAQVAALLTDLAHSQGLALILVTHDLQVAARCDRVIHLRDGRLEGVINSLSEKSVEKEESGIIQNEQL